MRFTGRVLSVVGPGLVVAGCFAVGEGVLPPLHRNVPDAGPPGLLFVDASATGHGPADASLPSLAPHSVASVDPAYGPFTGGNRAIVRGTGFSSAVRVWFGDVEVDAASIVPIDPGHVQVDVPPGHGGTIDVSAQNGDDDSTRATLPQGYVYDSFYVDPSRGPLSGGTRITLHGDGTKWDADTRVLVDQTECAVVAIRNPPGLPQELDCETPPGTQGAKRVSVITEAGATDVLDAFVYADTDDGLRGGLSGGAIAGHLHVIAVNSSTGRALGGATVILGSDATADSVKTADANGVVDLLDPALSKAVTVTVAAHCFMPTTFVGVPVDTVTAYLDPILSPDCIPPGSAGGIPVGQGGGASSSGANIEGELVWSGGIEFKRAPWDVPRLPEDVPDGSTDIRRVAYVFPLSRDPNQAFRLPAKSQGVTEKDVGVVGYKFKTSAAVGNLTLYALAGIEDRTQNPAIFTAYTLGIVSGVGTAASSVAKDVYIQMNVPLDHSILLDVTGPTPTPRGPDHVKANVGIRVGTFGYVILPIGTQRSLLPATAPLGFVGLPPLVKGLAGAEYVTTTSAYTGQSESPPRSVLASIATVTPVGPIRQDGFVQVPHLAVPGQDGAWNGRDLTVSSAPGGPDADLTVIEIDSGGGLSTWTVTLPKGVTSVRLPDLAAVDSLVSPTGPVSIDVTRAAITGFDYGSLSYANLTSGGWTAYAQDVFQAHH